MIMYDLLKFKELCLGMLRKCTTSLRLAPAHGSLSWVLRCVAVSMASAHWTQLAPHNP